MTPGEMRVAALLCAVAWAVLAAGVCAGILAAWAIDDWRAGQPPELSPPGLTPRAEIAE
ncbi:hypothetical protein [Amaricoccus sp.]|uniref:hypothetical protein n=1 Tax=Amaricoccus sp. TaxID=1872485 RepID=UPI002613E51D|nr:hypothetical protein [uncultured Amaricoccus sp.]